MPLINWNNSLSVSVPEMDKQHQKLIGMINDLNDAMRQGQGNAALGKIMSNLIAYTRTHFAAEEAYLAKHDSPDLAEQKQQHAAFIQKVAGFKADLDKGSIGLSVKVLNFLSDWLQTHIKGTDRKYASLANAKGAA